MSSLPIFSVRNFKEKEMISFYSARDLLKKKYAFSHYYTHPQIQTHIHYIGICIIYKNTVAEFF